MRMYDAFLDVSQSVSVCFVQFVRCAKSRLSGRRASFLKAISFESTTDTTQSSFPFKDRDGIFRDGVSICEAGQCSLSSRNAVRNRLFGKALETLVSSTAHNVGARQLSFGYNSAR